MTIKFRIIALAMLLAGFACQAQNQIDRQGRKQGHWLKTDKNGVKIFEGNFKDGQETGTFEYFYPDGTLRMKNVFEADGKRCYHEAYDEKGRRLASGYYNQKNRDGEWRFYNEEGQLVKIGTYRMGVKEGPQIVFNAATGDTAEVSTWMDNHRNGRWWKRIGKQGYITATYAKGGIEGTLVEYNDDNQLIREGHYKDGRKHGTYRYYSNNEMTVDETWDDGLMIDRKILLKTPEAQYVSVYSIAYLVPQGKSKVIVYMMDGSKMTTLENHEDVYERLGNGDIFTSANKKSRIMVAMRCVNGTKLDSEGRAILDLTPTPDFVIFPDEDCERMLKSRQHQLDALKDDDQQ